VVHMTLDNTYSLLKSKVVIYNFDCLEHELTSGVCTCVCAPVCAHLCVCTCVCARASAWRYCTVQRVCVSPPFRAD